MEINVGDTVYIRRIEEHWDRPYPVKRHSVMGLKAIILKGEVKEKSTLLKSQQFKIFLSGNNGFERDNDTWVFLEKEIIKDTIRITPEMLWVWEIIREPE